MAESQGAKHLNCHLQLDDDKKIRFGSASDATLSFDGTDLVLNTQLVGSGNLKLSAGSIELIDNANLILGTGEDATIDYDGTDLVIDPQVVGSGNLKLNAGSLEIKTDNGKVIFGAGEDCSIEYDGTDMVINPQDVGSGNVKIEAGSLELIDSGALILGTGEDADILYDGTRLRIDPEKVGTGECVVEGKLVAQKHTFDDRPLVQQDDGTAVSGTDTEVNIHQYPGLNLYVQNIGTQTILIPANNALGMDYAYDQTDNEGIQWVAKLNGTKGINNKTTFTIGTSPAFFASLKFSIADVSGTDDCLFGFRKDAAFQAAVDDYTDMAALNVISGDINIETILNNSATTTTDTTDNWADAATHTLKVLVSASGVVTYQIDGAAPTATAAFTFDSADVVTPFFYMIHATDLAGAVVLQELEMGLQ